MNRLKVGVIFFLFIIFVCFSIYIYKSKQLREVLVVYSPTKIGVDLNKNTIIDSNEIVCTPGFNSFSLENPIEYNNLSYKDLVSLGYLAQDFAQKTLQHKRVKVIFNNKITSECRYGDIILDGLNYKNIFLDSGFGLKDGKVINLEKFSQNLNDAKKLNLVIFNHHSNKYHKLDCKYGSLAHDKVLIPLKHLPKFATPCRFCHEINNKLKKQNYESKNPTNNLFIPQLVHSDGNITLYYTNFTKHLKPDNYCQTSECRAFVKLVNEAKDSIDIAIYGYDEVAAITNALINAKNRGVKIRYVYDMTSDTKSFYQDNDKIINLSTQHSSDKFSPEVNKIMHNKFTIFDKKKLFTGSMNFSKTGLSGYDENDVIIINSSDIANLYEAEFEQMFNGKFHSAKSKHNLNNIFELGSSIIEVYFSPQDKSSKRIISLINNAKSYIYLPTFLITHTKITNALIDAHKRGVDVRIIMDANNTSTRNSKHKLLRASNIPLKVENYAGKMHSKTIIIDNEYIIIGSMNFSNSGENKNDENMLVIRNPELAKGYAEFFMYLWKSIPDKYLKQYVRAESIDSLGSCSDGVDNNFDGKIDKDDVGCKNLEKIK